MSNEAKTLTSMDDSEVETLVPLRGTERKFGRYDLGYEIASGGMATVYLARARGPGGFDRLVAIKRIHPHLAKQAEFVEMFLDEARVAARINHPNVCSVFDFGEVEGSYFMAMEYMLGQPLSALLRAASMHPELTATARWQALAARIVADVCEGLHCAHELADDAGRPLGIVHRDVTPQNVFVTYDGAVKILDFGVAWAHGRMHETRTGVVKGKFAYMAPEQLQGRAIDRRLDVWALGVCLWELLAVKRLFGRRSDAELVLAVVGDPIVPPSRVQPTVPAALDAIVMRALERDADRRYPSARAMARELNAFVQSSGVPAGLAELAELMGELVPNERNKKLGVAATMLARREPVIADEPTKSGARLVPTAIDDTPPVEPEAPPSGPAEVHAPDHAKAITRALAIGAVLVAAGGIGLIAALTLAPSPRTERPTIVLGPMDLEVPSPPRPTGRSVEQATLPREEPPSDEPSAREDDEPSQRRVPPARSITHGTGTVNVAARGGWAEIYVDGAPAGRTPKSLPLPAGRHVIEVRWTGHAPIRRTVTVRRGETTPLVVPLE